MLLATNGLSKWPQGRDMQDVQLVSNALLNLDAIAEASDSDKLRGYRDACVSMHEGARARISVSARSSRYGLK
jgi:hypothetical protein